MSEVKTTQCRICNQLKPRIQYGTYTNSKNKRWVDENGKQWSGLTCPDCHKKRTLVNMHRLRNNRKNSVDE